MLTSYLRDIPPYALALTLDKIPEGKNYLYQTTRYPPTSALRTILRWEVELLVYLEDT